MKVHERRQGWVQTSTGSAPRQLSTTVATEGAVLVTNRDMCSQQFFLCCKITMEEFLTLCEGISRYKLELIPQTKIPCSSKEYKTILGLTFIRF